MFGLVICLIVIILKAEAVDVDNEPKEIPFHISVVRVNNNKTLTCDPHNEKNINQNKYTLLEGGEVKLEMKKESFVTNRLQVILRCVDLYNNSNILLSNPEENIDTCERHTSVVHKNMGAIWKCTILVHRYNATIPPVINFCGHKYSGVYCYMRIHVRQKTSPLTILVNNMVVEQVRTSLVEKVFDFTAVYEYGDGDIVDVSCTSLQTGSLLKMEYSYADTLSDAFDIKDLTSDVRVGFRVKMHRHNNTYMICIQKEPKDYTMVMVRFVMKTKYDNVISLIINGMILRPKLREHHYYGIVYEYISNQRLTVECKVNREDVNLVVVDDLSSAVYSHNKTVTEKGAKMSFITEFKKRSPSNFRLICEAYFKSNHASAEIIQIKFIQANKFNDQCALHMDLPSNGTVMELYDSKHLKVIYYEFEDGEKLTLKCYSDCKGPVMYLQFKDSVEHSSSSISQTLQLSSHQDNTIKACYMKEKSEPSDPKDDKVIREIRVIFRERVLTTTIAPTTKVPIISSFSTTAVPVDPNATTELPDDGSIDSTIIIIVVILSAVAFILMIVILVMKRCWKKVNPPQRPQLPIDTNRFYVNLLFRRQCQQEIEEQEQNHYEEIESTEQNHYEEIE